MTLLQAHHGRCLRDGGDASDTSSMLKFTARVDPDIITPACEAELPLREHVERRAGGERTSRFLPDGLAAPARLAYAILRPELHLFSRACSSV